MHAERNPEESKGWLDELSADLGPERAAFIDPKKREVIEVVPFSRPADDPRPPPGRFEEVALIPFRTVA